MKIVVRDSRRSTLGSMNVDIKELGSELEEINRKGAFGSLQIEDSPWSIHVTSENGGAEGCREKP